LLTETIKASEKKNSKGNTENDRISTSKERTMGKQKKADYNRWAGWTQVNHSWPSMISGEKTSKKTVQELRVRYRSGSIFCYPLPEGKKSAGGGLGAKDAREPD